MIDINLQGLVIIQAAWKCVYFILIFDDYLKLVTITTHVLSDVVLFICMVAVALFGFMKISQVIQMGVNDQTGEFSQYSSYKGKLMI